jgi:predicted AAA+ superfamily ATPase
MYQLRDQPTFLEEIESIRQTGTELMGMLAGAPRHLDLEQVMIKPPSIELWEASQRLFDQYVREGGFPEVWTLPSWEQKIEYLYEKQVKKVIYEDLVLAAEFRKPEQLKHFYLSLLERPGREVNLSGVANETKISVQQVEKYLPLLEMTDLVAHIGKFRKSPLRVRRGSVKFYLIDLALRNAVLRLSEHISHDTDTLRLYAENLVFNALRKWRGTLAIDYYRERDEEIDFIVHTRPQHYLAVESKYRDTIQTSDLRALRGFKRRFGGHQGLVISKRFEDFGPRDDVFLFPLVHFLLLFD